MRSGEQLSRFSVPFVLWVVMMPDMPEGTEPSADVASVQRALLANLGVRVDEQTAQYLLKQFAQRRTPCAIYACDGRTGAPLRIEVLAEAIVDAGANTGQAVG